DHRLEALVQIDEERVVHRLEADAEEAALRGVWPVGWFFSAATSRESGDQGRCQQAERILESHHFIRLGDHDRSGNAPNPSLDRTSSSSRSGSPRAINPAGRKRQPAAIRAVR